VSSDAHACAGRVALAALTCVECVVTALRVGAKRVHSVCSASRDDVHETCERRARASCNVLATPASRCVAREQRGGKPRTLRKKVFGDGVRLPTEGYNTRVPGTHATTSPSSWRTVSATPGITKITALSGSRPTGLCFYARRCLGGGPFPFASATPTGLCTATACVGYAKWGGVRLPHASATPTGLCSATACVGYAKWGGVRLPHASATPTGLCSAAACVGYAKWDGVGCGMRRLRRPGCARLRHALAAPSGLCSATACVGYAKWDGVGCGMRWLRRLGWGRLRLRLRHALAWAGAGSRGGERGIDRGVGALGAR